MWVDCLVRVDRGWGVGTLINKGILGMKCGHVGTINYG